MGTNMTFALMFLSNMAHLKIWNLMMMYIVMIGVLSIPSVNFGICKDAAVLINIDNIVDKYI